MLCSAKRIKIRSGDPACACAAWGSCSPGSRGRPLYRQERLEPRHRCPFRTQRAETGGGRYRQGKRAEVARYRQVRRHRHGEGADRRSKRHDFCGIRIGRAQGQSDRRSGAWAHGYAPTRSISTRPSPKKTRSGRANRTELRLCQSRHRRRRPGRSTRRLPTASCSPAISSTNRPTCSIRGSSHGEPRL